MRVFPFPFLPAPRDRGNRDRESARDGIAGAVPTEPTASNERGERGLEGGVPGLAALAERRRRERGVGGFDLGEDALVDGELGGRGRDERGRRTIDRGERDHFDHRPARATAAPARAKPARR